MARDIYTTINIDKRTKPFTYRLQIIKVLKDGKRKTTLHKSYLGANVKTLAKQEKIRLENELLAGTAGVSEKQRTIDAYTTTKKKAFKVGTQLPFSLWLRIKNSQQPKVIDGIYAGFWFKTIEKNILEEIEPFSAF
jgi:hypothetical protein